MAEAAYLNRFSAISNTCVTNTHAVCLHLGAFNRAGRTAIGRTSMMTITTIIDVDHRRMRCGADRAGTDAGDAAFAEAPAVKTAAKPIAAVTTNDLSDIADILKPFQTFIRWLSPETPNK